MSIVETVSDYVCTQCGLCIQPRLSQDKYVLENRLKQYLDATDYHDQPVLSPVHPCGTIIGGIFHPWQRKNNWHLNHDGETQGQQRMRDRVRALSRSLGLNEALERAAYQLSLRVLRRNPKRDSDRYMYAATAGLVGTIRSRHLPITMGQVLRAIRQHGRPGLRWGKLSHRLLTDPTIACLLRRQSPSTYLPQVLEHALVVIADHNGHASNGQPLRAQLTQLSETFLATAHPRPSAHPKIVAAACVYAACHELLHPCPVTQASFRPLVAEFSLRFSLKVDLAWRDYRR